MAAVGVGISVPGYTIIAKHKEGGSAAIFKARKHPYNEVVALKVLHEKHMGNKEMTKAFMHEAQILEGMKHKNIIRFHRVVDGSPRPTIEMELFDSEHLKALLVKREKPYGYAEAIAVAKQAAEALQFIHEKNIAHHDVKPENILVNKDGVVKLIDFSIAEEIATSFFKRLFAGKPKIQGTLTYLAPEQIQQQKADQRADLYSFGLVLYEMLTGKPPFKAQSQDALIRAHLSERPVPPSRAREDVPKELEALVLRMLEKSPDRRPQTMQAVIDEMAKIAAALPAGDGADGGEAGEATEAAPA